MKRVLRERRDDILGTKARGYEEGTENTKELLEIKETQLLQ